MVKRRAPLSIIGKTVKSKRAQAMEVVIASGRSSTSMTTPVTGLAHCISVHIEAFAGHNQIRLSMDVEPLETSTKISRLGTHINNGIQIIDHHAGGIAWLGSLLRRSGGFSAVCYG
jgi:hypothetical protein